MFLLFFPALTAAGFFSNHIERYVNVSIDPCDDFYDHVCTAAVKDGHFFNRKGPEQLHNLFRQTAALEVQHFRTVVKNNTANFPDVPMGIEDSNAFDQFVGVTLDQCDADWVKRLATFDFFDGFEAYDGFTRLKNTPHFHILKKKITDIYSELKNILIAEFTDAVWTQRYPQLVEYLKTVELIYVEADDLQLDKEVVVLKQRYEECLGTTSNKTRTLSQKCSEYVMCSNADILHKIQEFMKFAFTDNARNWDNTVKLSLMYYTLEEEDLPYMLGGLDFTIFHEIGHVFFNGKGAKPSNSECFRNHISDTCKRYINTSECSIDDISYYVLRFGDDASDWIGVYGGLKALRHYFPKIFPDDSLKNCTPESIKIMKQFFYAYAVNWCNSNPQTGDLFHSPRKIRVNGISSLFQEFSEVFQCESGSRMAKCFIWRFGQFFCHSEERNAEHKCKNENLMPMLALEHLQENE